MSTTTDIIGMHRRSGVHPTGTDLIRVVSTTSTWNAELWLLDSPTRNFARSGIKLDWSTFPLQLVPAFKELLWSLLISRPDGQPYALSQVATLFARLRYFAKWMGQRKRKSFSSITPAFADTYVSDLKAHLRKEAKSRDDEFTTGHVVGYLKVLEFAFEQRSILLRNGHPGLGFPPFGEASAWGVAEEIVPHVDVFTPPIPDALVIPIVARAYEFIREVADDVMELQELVLALERKRIGTKDPRTLSRKQFIKLRPLLISDWAKRRVAERPWLSDLVSDEPDATRGESAVLQLRRLFADVVAAAIIVLRFSTGVRHSEILTFAPGVDDDGLPLCVEHEKSVSGAYDLYFVKGTVSKGWDHPEDTRWLLAGSVSNDGRIPDAVRALQVIDRLLAPWRERSTDPDVKKQLLLQFGVSGFPNSPSDILPMLSRQLGLVMKDFYERRVDRSGIDFTDPNLASFEGIKIRNIQSKQWRKTWANFVFRTNRKLLPAIAQQFQHFSTVLTQEAYIGKDAEQLGLIEDAATERAIEFMHNAMEGKPGVGGMARKAVDKLDDLKAKVRGLSGGEQREAIGEWLSERDIKMWPAQHGKCFVGLLPTGSRCHAAGATLDWSNQAPNFLTRNPRLCSGCACFAVDEDDIPFWAQRYLENKRIWEDAASRHLDIHYAVARERFLASERVLRSLNVDVDQL